MKRLILLLCGALAGCASGQPAGQSASAADAVGTWQTRRSAEANISVSLPCNPTSSTSTPGDGYGHTVQEIELRCSAPLGGQGQAFFRMVRKTFPSDPTLARADFAHYLDVVHSSQSHGPMVRLAGQQTEVHLDYALKQQKIGGDLGFHDLGDSCMWNFVGLQDETGVQAIMILPKSMCPKGDEPVVSAVASRYFDSIFLEQK